jgi:hypothetical protein
MHNYVALGTVALPLVPNIIFKEIVEDLNKGEVELYLVAKEQFSFESFQKRMVKDKYRECIEKQNNNP